MNNVDIIILMACDVQDSLDLLALKNYADSSCILYSQATRLQVRDMESDSISNGALGLLNSAGK